VALYLLLWGGYGILARIVFPLVSHYLSGHTPLPSSWDGVLYDLLEIVKFTAGLGLLCQLRWARPLAFLALAAWAIAGLNDGAAALIGSAHFPTNFAYADFRVIVQPLMALVTLIVMIAVLATINRERKGPRALPAEALIIGWFLLAIGLERTFVYLGVLFTPAGGGSLIMPALMFTWSALTAITGIGLLAQLPWSRTPAIFILAVKLINEAIGFTAVGKMLGTHPGYSATTACFIIASLVIYGVMIRLLASPAVKAAFMPAEMPEVEEQPAPPPVPAA